MLVVLQGRVVKNYIIMYRMYCTSEYSNESTTINVDYNKVHIHIYISRKTYNLYTFGNVLKFLNLIITIILYSMLGLYY